MASQASQALERQLRTAGRRRLRALADAAEQLEAIRELYPAARDAGLSIFRIHELTGVSRTILHRLERKRK